MSTRLADALWPDERQDRNPLCWQVGFNPLKMVEYCLHGLSYELGLTQFNVVMQGRSTQAEDKLRRDQVQGKDNANQVHL